MWTDWTIKHLGRLPLLMVLICGGLVAYFGMTFLNLQAVDSSIESSATPELSWAEPDLPSEDAWSVLYAEAAASTGQSSLASRFRLAGTFFLTAGDSGQGVRKAVLDDLEKKRQHLVVEGERLEAIEVKKVYDDHVVLLYQGKQEELWLSFSGRAASGSSKGSEGKPEKELRWDERVLESNRWGNRIAENRWIIKRDEIMQYYRDVMDDPERLASLFISMRAVRSEKEGNKITGYRLRPTGEEEFYYGVGMKEGDIVRKVNSMKMTRQERAEYFIKELVQDRVNVLVLDIERDGQDQQLIYYLR